MNNDVKNDKDLLTNGKQDKDSFATLNYLPISVLDWLESKSNLYMVIWDVGGEIKYINKNLENLLGCRHQCFMTKSWYDHISIKDMQYLLEKINNADNSVDDNKELFLNIKTGDNETLLFKYKFKVIKDEQEKYYCICYMNKTDNQTTLDSEIIQSEKLTVAGQLAAGIAHEIRNPLTSLKGFLQLLQAGINKKEVYYKIMHEEIEKIEAITSELIYLSKPLTNERKKESVRSMIEDVIMLLRLQAKMDNVTIKTLFYGNYQIVCDRSQMKQVLLNIIKNAIEVSCPNDEVLITVRKTSKSIEIDVRDEGPGIPSEELEEIGEPFFTTKHGGTGLGLMISKRILASHAAKLHIFNNEENGATFRIEIPIMD